jgi:cell division protein FtsB
MRDISRRLKRYRLSRYALPDDPVRRHFKWIWLLPFAWIAWAGVISDHSLYRIWRLDQESKQSAARLAETQGERERLESEHRDPEAQKQNAERLLRVKNGMARPTEIIYQIRDVPADSLGK